MVRPVSNDWEKAASSEAWGLELVLFGVRGWDNRSHLEDLGSCLELVALIPVCQEVNGLAHVVSGILDLGTAPTTHKTKVY